MIIIGGPTACGKTAFAASLCKLIGGEIVSADSMQIYKGMDIGTAKESNEALGISQHCVDIVEPDKPFTVVDYKNAAEAAIKDIESRGRRAVVTGGTGFYINSLLYQLTYGNMSNEALRQELYEELEKKGALSLHNRLSELDKEAAEKIHPNNTKRLIRALEVCISTGKPFSKQDQTDKGQAAPHKMFIIKTDRAVLRERIENRVDLMFSKGLQTEVQNLLNQGVTFDMQSMQGIGYKEWRGCFEGKMSAEEVKQLIIKNTNAYAKRQQTWFHNQYKDAVFIDFLNINMQKTADEITEYYNLSNNI